MNLQVIEIKEEKDLLASVKVIRESFATVAKEFNYYPDGSMSTITTKRVI